MPVILSRYNLKNILPMVLKTSLRSNMFSSILVKQWSYLGAGSNYVLCQDYMEQAGEGYFNNNTIRRNSR